MNAKTMMIGALALTVMAIPVDAQVRDGGQGHRGGRAAMERGAGQGMRSASPLQATIGLALRAGDRIELTEDQRSELEALRIQAREADESFRDASRELRADMEQGDITLNAVRERRESIRESHRSVTLPIAQAVDDLLSVEQERALQRTGRAIRSQHGQRRGEGASLRRDRDGRGGGQAGVRRGGGEGARGAPGAAMRGSRRGGGDLDADAPTPIGDPKPVYDEFEDPPAPEWLDESDALETM